VGLLAGDDLDLKPIELDLVVIRLVVVIGLGWGEIIPQEVLK
jgi:hypothetical protein